MLPYSVKAQRDAQRMQRASMAFIEGAGEKGSKPRPFSHEAAVAHFRSWVYAAAMLNANAVASTPMRLYVRKRSGSKCLFQTRPVTRHRKRYLAGDMKQTPHGTTMRKMMEMGDYEEVIEQHPLTTMLAKVNPYFNGFDFNVLRILWQELTGNAYVLKVQGLGESQPPTELWPLPPQWTWIIPGKEEWIKGYLYGKDSTNRVAFEADEVIHFRRPNPKDLFYGLGKVEAAWSAVALNESNHEMDLALSDNHARPDYLVVTEGATSEQLDRLDAQIRAKLRGKRKSGTFLSVGGKVDVKPLNFPPKDLVGRDDVVEEIAAIFGVPVSMLKANDPNLASAETGYASWRETTVLPLCRMDEEQLNQNLVSMYGDDLCLAYDNPVPSNEAFALDQRSRYVQGGIITANEARIADGYEPMDDANADKLLINGQPLGGITFDLSSLGGAMDDADVETTDDQGDTEVPPVAADVDVPVGSDQEIQTTEATVLNGAQISSAKDIVLAVVAGQLPRDSGVAMLEAFFNLTPEKAEAIMGSAGKPVATTPNPVGDAGKPSADAAPVAPAADAEDAADDEEDDQPEPEKSYSLKALMMGGQAWPCTCDDHDDVTKSWNHYRTKASADDTVRDEPENPLVTFSAKMTGIFTRQRADIVKVLDAAKLPVKEAGSAEQLIAELAEAIAAYDAEVQSAVRPFIGRMAQVGGNVGVATVNNMRPDLALDVFDVQNPRVAEFLDSYAVKLREEIQGYTGEAISQTVKGQLSEGRTTRDIASALREDASLGGGSLSPARSETIARTESARAYVEGERKAWEGSGVVEGKQWLLAPDACEFCQAVSKQFNEKKVPLNEPFFKKGSTITAGDATMKLDYSDVQGPPLHPNDRCDLVPILEDI